MAHAHQWTRDVTPHHSNYTDIALLSGKKVFSRFSLRKPLFGESDE